MKLALNIIALGLAISLTACKKAPEPVAAPASAPVAAPAAAAPPAAAANPAAPATLMAELDWSTVPEATGDIGTYPYFKAPDLLMVQTESGRLSTTGFTKEEDFGKLISYTGTNFYPAEGRVTTLWFAMAESGKNFNQYVFDKSMDAYILGLGAKLLFKGTVPRELRDELKKTDKDAEYRYMVSGVGSDDPVRFYAFKQKEKKLMIQVSSNSAASYVKFVELKEFKQTIQKYSAEGMKKDIDATGKAIVNINFDTDKSTLKADGQDVVNQIVALLKGAPALKLSIEGHTDNTGSAERNKALSAERSNAVMLALVSTGIDKGNLKSAGFGADKPLVANDSEENKAKNRRVELVKF